MTVSDLKGNGKLDLKSLLQVLMEYNDNIDKHTKIIGELLKYETM